MPKQMMKKVCSRRLEVVQYQRHGASDMEQAPAARRRVPKRRLIVKDLDEVVLVIKLIRTDTTLDLSQKAKLKATC